MNGTRIGEIRKCDYTKTWKCGFVETRRCGNVEMWKRRHGHLESKELASYITEKTVQWNENGTKFCQNGIGGGGIRNTFHFSSLFLPILGCIWITSCSSGYLRSKSGLVLVFEKNISKENQMKGLNLREYSRWCACGRVMKEKTN